MPYDDIPPDTPFDQKLNDDVEARRAAPTAGTIRIGDAAVGAAPVHLASTAPQDSSNTVTPQNSVVRERTPLPIMIGLAMALGAVCVAGGSLVMHRLLPQSQANHSTVVQGTPDGDVLMDPNSVVQAPDTEENPVTPQETPAVEIEAAPATEKADGSAASLTPKSEVPMSPSQPYSASTYEIAPPQGFTLQQAGRRTIWKHENGAQLLVETGKAGAGSLREGWQRLERDLQKRYGDGYKSLGISEGTLAGQPAAVWEFELTGKDGVTRRKIDIGIQHEGRGYALLGSAPREKFDAVFPQIRAALDSFKLKTSEAKEDEKKPDVKALPTVQSGVRENPASAPAEETNLPPKRDDDRPKQALPAPKATERGY
jgi:hypothetical protein